MPNADFACLGPRCQTAAGEATVYELPVGSTRCPVCGSKRVRQLFNKIAVLGTRNVQPDIDPRLTSDSHFARSTALLQPGFDHADSVKPPKNMKSYALPISEIGYGGGKGRPMQPMEVARAKKDNPYGLVATLDAQLRHGHTIPVVAPS